MVPDLWLDEDPLPTPPAPYGTTAYWRWRSQQTLRPEQIAADERPCCGGHYLDPCQPECRCDVCHEARIKSLVGECE